MFSSEVIPLSVVFIDAASRTRRPKPKSSPSKRFWLDLAGHLILFAAKPVDHLKQVFVTEHWLRKNLDDQQRSRTAWKDVTP